MKKNVLYGFLKFSKHENHLVDLVKNGVVYFNHYSTFFSRKGEESLQFDNSEGAPYHYLPEDIRYIQFNEYRFKLAGSFTPHTEPPELQYIFCLYEISKVSLSLSTKNQVYDPNLWKDFGEYLVLIHNTDKFLDRIMSQLEKQKINGKLDLVEYVDTKKYSGELGIFRKKSSYHYQNEYRIAICPKTDESFYKIELGDISDIAIGPVHKNECKNSYISDHVTI